MKRIFLIIYCLLTTLHSNSQQNIRLSDGYISDSLGNITPVQTIEEVEDGIIVSYSFENAYINNSGYHNGSFVHMDGFYCNTVEIHGDMIVPLGAELEIRNE